MVKDDLDKKIINTVKENADGIRLYELSRTLNRNAMTVKYRLMQMALDGDIRIERGHNLLKACPANA